MPVSSKGARHQAISVRFNIVVSLGLSDFRRSRCFLIGLASMMKMLNYGREAEGMRLLAAQFRVGAMRETGDRLSFIMGQSAIWQSDKGWTGNAEGVLFGKCGFGAMRKFD